MGLFVLAGFNSGVRIFHVTGAGVVGAEDYRADCSCLSRGQGERDRHFMRLNWSSRSEMCNRLT